MKWTQLAARTVFGTLVLGVALTGCSSSTDAGTPAGSVGAGAAPKDGALKDSAGNPIKPR